MTKTVYLKIEYIMQTATRMIRVSHGCIITTIVKTVMVLQSPKLAKTVRGGIKMSKILVSLLNLV